MKKFITLTAIAALALATTVSFADEKKDGKSCSKEAKSCCKSGNSAKACAKAGETKSCHDKESKENKSSNENVSPKN